MQLKEIGYISRDFIERYEKLERSANRLLSTNSDTKIDECKLCYQQNLDAVDGTDF